MKTYTLTNADGKRYESTTQGTLGGHKRNKGYGRQRIIGLWTLLPYVIILTVAMVFLWLLLRAGPRNLN